MANQSNFGLGWQHVAGLPADVQVNSLAIPGGTLYVTVYVDNNGDTHVEETFVPTAAQAKPPIFTPIMFVNAQGLAVDVPVVVENTNDHGQQVSEQLDLILHQLQTLTALLADNQPHVGNPL